MAADVIRRHTYGQPLEDAATFIGIATLDAVEPKRRGDYVRVIRQIDGAAESLDGYGGVLTDASGEELRQGGDSLPIRVIHSAEHLEHIQEGDVLKLDFERGYVRSLYRMGSPHNVIFATDRCNSNCLMCSQPPKDIDDSRVIGEHLRLISLIPPTTKALCITGGEPTLLVVSRLMWKM